MSQIESAGSRSLTFRCRQPQNNRNRMPVFLTWALLVLLPGLAPSLWVSADEVPAASGDAAIAATVQATEKVFRGGAATVDISPEELPSIIAGGFLEGRGTEVKDRLFVRSIVLDDGQIRIALVVVDTCMMAQNLIDEAKQLAHRACGIPVDHIMVSATHTHSAPAAMGCLGTRQDAKYAAGLPPKIAESITKAVNNLQPAKIGWASIDDWEHTHNRRWIRKPDKQVVDPFGRATGRAHMHPGYQSNQVIGPSGPVDPALSVISLQSPTNQPIAIWANYSQHYFGTGPISADYYGLFCKYLADSLKQAGDGNGPFVAAISQGTSGDLMWMDYGVPAKQITMARYAEAVATYADKALAQVKYHTHVSLGMIEKKLSLKYRVPDSERLAWAKPIADRIENDRPKNVQEVYAREALILHERQQTEIKLQAIRIGDLTIATLPNEVYALTGLKLRGRSPSEMHFNIELANGAEGYIPPPEQHVLGGYTTWPARTAGLEVEAEPRIVETLVQALEEVTGKPRRTMLDQHGSYAQAMLDAKPLDYWRLNDEEGQLTRNAVPGRAAARLEPGYAHFLPGVDSGTGIGSGERLTESNFSGPNQINRAIHFAGGSLTADSSQLGSSYSIAFWFWLGERSGASERSGTLCHGPLGEQLVVHQNQEHQLRLECQSQQSSFSGSADNWHFVVMVREQNIVRVYLNGAEKPVLEVQIPNTSPRSDLQFARNLEGKLDEIGVFNRALSGAEINRFWNASGVAERQAALERERQRLADIAASKHQAPVFAQTYQQTIEELKPCWMSSLQQTPDSWQLTGELHFDNKTFASARAGRMKKSFPELADHYSIAFWFLNELPIDARPVTAYLLSRGIDGDRTAPGEHLGIGGTYSADLTGRLIVFNGNQRNEVVAGKSRIAAGTWNHVVYTREGKRVRVWLNGQPKPDIDASIEIVAPDNHEFYLAARSDQFASLQGGLAYVAFFDHPLTEEQAQQLHRASGQKTEAVIIQPPEVASPLSQPISPAESLAKIHAPPGFRVDLVAAEPEVLDPVAFDWDAQGRLWVVEMADYPLGVDGQGKPGGRVALLEDTNHDGRYDKRQVFAEDLNFPNGILCWRDGVLVTAAPQILWLRDTNNDGRADIQEVLFEGFKEGNQQLRMNGLRWGLDGWVYCANGGHHAKHGLGTRVTSKRAGESYEVGSNDFRFSPDTGKLELESGPSQFGRNRNAWGDWFGTQNANPLWHYVIPDRYLARNPFNTVPSSIQHVVGPNSPEVFPASPPEKRFHNFQQAGRFTSACSGMIYGDRKLFPDVSRQHAFTCEPFHNCVQHNVLTPSGVSFTSSRPSNEGPTDFFASEDRWCRPVMARTGPDGGLWIADMYRYMIEHPDWLPPAGKAELLPHYRLGDDRGRIYRIVPQSEPTNSATQSRLPLPSPNQPYASQLVAALDSPNDWQRDKAHQLLLWTEARSAIPLLIELTQRSQFPEVRVQCMSILAGWEALSDDLLRSALQDPHPRIREHALRLTERSNNDALRSVAMQLSNDPDTKVQLQLILSLGQWKETTAGNTLAELAVRTYQQPFMVAAVMSSSLPHSDQLVQKLSQADYSIMQVYLAPLIKQSLAQQNYNILSRLLKACLTQPPADSLAALDTYFRILQLAGAEWSALVSQSAGQLDSVAGDVSRRQQEAQVLAADPNLDPAMRLQAIQFLSRFDSQRKDAIAQATQWLNPRVPPENQKQVLRLMTESALDDVPQSLTRAWPEFSPELRSEALNVWLSRATWTNDLLDRIASGEIKLASIDLAQRARMSQHPQPAIAKRAKQLLETSETSRRAEVVTQYMPSLKLASDPQRGQAVYLRACANCHRRGDSGIEVGPNLATVLAHEPEKLLKNILDPSADIQPGYLAYHCVLDSGEIVSGLLTAENATSFTIKQAGGATRTIPRNEVERLQSAGVSFMPEGLETSLTPQDMADLIYFLRQPLSTVIK